MKFPSDAPFKCARGGGGVTSALRESLSLPVYGQEGPRPARPPSEEQLQTERLRTTPTQLPSPKGLEVGGQ